MTVSRVPHHDDRDDQRVAALGVAHQPIDRCGGGGRRWVGGQEARPDPCALQEKWLRDQLKDQRVDELFSAMVRMAGVDEPAAMSPEDVAQEIATMRAERRAKNAS